MSIVDSFPPGRLSEEDPATQSIPELPVYVPPAKYNTHPSHCWHVYEGLTRDRTFRLCGRCSSTFYSPEASEPCLKAAEWCSGCEEEPE